MKIIEGGNNIAIELSPEQLTILKKLLNLKVEEYFPEGRSNAGFMIFSDLTSIFNHENMYVEFFFDRKTDNIGSNKIILYDGDEPDEVLDAMIIIQKECSGFKVADISNDIKVKI